MYLSYLYPRLGVPHRMAQNNSLPPLPQKTHTLLSCPQSYQTLKEKKLWTCGPLYYKSLSIPQLSIYIQIWRQTCLKVIITPNGLMTTK